MKIEPADRIANVQEYYFSRKLREIAQRRANGESIINLGIGSPDLPPHPEVVEALQTAAADLSNHGYQSYRGIPEVRQAFQGFYKRKFQVDLDPEQEILPLMGSKEGIMHLSMAYLNPGDQVLVPNPGYPTYSAASKLTGAEIVNYVLDEASDWSPNLSALEEQDLGKVKIMWVNYPHMPTGQQGTRELFEKLVAFGLQHNILICHDNPYSFILNDDPASILQVDGALDCCVELISLSKTFNMAGWRIGALAANAERIKDVLKFKSNMDSGMFRPLQLAAVKALNLPDRWHVRMNTTYQRRKEQAIKILETLGCHISEGQVGMFVWGQVGSNHADGVELSESLLNATGVFITPGMIFGSQGERYMRISLCTSEPRLKEALERVSDFVQKKKLM